MMRDGVIAIGGFPARDQHVPRRRRRTYNAVRTGAAGAPAAGRCGRPTPAFRQGARPRAGENAGARGPPRAASAHVTPGRVPGAHRRRDDARPRRRARRRRSLRPARRDGDRAPDDGEGEIPRACAGSSGPHVPVVASLDLHARTSPDAMMAFADGMVAYRTYRTSTWQPRVPACRGGCCCARSPRATPPRGDAAARFPDRPVVAVDVHRARRACTRWNASSASTTVLSRRAFPMADFPGMPDGGVRLRPRRRRACAAVGERRSRAVHDAEPGSRSISTPTRQSRARGAARRAGAPVVLADTQDNPAPAATATPPACSPRCWRAIPRDAVLGLLVDRASAAAGARARQRLALQTGRDVRRAGHVPLAGAFAVVALNDGTFTCTGPMFKGFRMQLGPMAVLQHGNVRVVLASKKVQAADRQMFRHRRHRARAAARIPRAQELRALPAPTSSPSRDQVLVVVAPGPAKGGPDDVPLDAPAAGPRLSRAGRRFRPA